MLSRRLGAPVLKRTRYLEDLARGKRVLDIGIVDHCLPSTEQAGWLHARIAAVAQSCLGVDVLEEEVRALRDQGWNVQVADVTQRPLADSFDLILAGEVIEHLDSPGLLFRHAAAMLAPNGRFVVTTPNPYALPRIWRGGRGTLRDSLDHVTSFTPSQICELGERAGLVLDVYRGVRFRTIPTVRGVLQSAVRRLATATVFTRETDCESMIYELVTADPNEVEP